jgi:hypothetical protein
MSIDVSAIKEGQRRMWSAGDYPDIARTIEEVAEVLVERVGAGPGDDLLDVGTGSQRAMGSVGRLSPSVAKRSP